MLFYLASGSPRRKELLEQIGIEPQIIIPEGIEEEKGIWQTSEKMVSEISFLKAQQIYEKTKSQDFILGADTVVVFQNEIFEKPKDRDDAIQMIRRLSGEVHQVLTGVTLFYSGHFQTEFEITQVRFRPLKEDEIIRYVDSLEPMDKAGGYGIQGKAAVFVERIEGCYFNVVGLPLTRLWKMMEKARDNK